MSRKVAGVVKITILVIIAIGVLAGISITVKKSGLRKVENKINEKIFGYLQSKEAEVTELFTYGTSLNISGRVSNISKDNFENARLILTDGLDYEKTCKLSGQIVEGALVFTTSDEINTGIVLDELEEKEYYILLRLKLNNNIDAQYYTLTNKSKNEDIEYYTITKDDENKKIDIKFLEKTYDKNKYNFLSVKVEKEELPDNIYDFVIDAGHGGKDKGEKSGNDTEADIVLEYAKELKVLLEQKGYKVKLTRDDANTGNFNYVNMYDSNGRITIACDTKAKYMISLHINNGVNSLKGLEVYAPSKSDLKLAEMLASNIVNSTSIEFSNNNSFKKLDGVYVKNFTKNVIKEYENTANKKGYEPYLLTTDTPFLYTIREVGGIATNAYVDGRNKEYEANKYYNSNQGIECYQIELGYIENDLNTIKDEKPEILAAITEAIIEYIK